MTRDEGMIDLKFTRSIRTNRVQYNKMKMAVFVVWLALNSLVFFIEGVKA